MPMQTIVPFLWFHEGAEEAMHFYTSIFTDSKVISVMPGAEGKAMGVDLEIRGLRLRIINGGPQFTINEGFHLWLIAKTRRKWIICGRNWEMVEPIKHADGSRISTASHGRLFQKYWDTLRLTRIARKQTRQCKRCSRCRKSTSKDSWMR
jgi:hypothetical protein